MPLINQCFFCLYFSSPNFRTLYHIPVVFLYSEVEAKEVTLLTDQIQTTKSENYDGNFAVEKSRTSKVRQNRTKYRRSPYQQHSQAPTPNDEDDYGNDVQGVPDAYCPPAMIESAASESVTSYDMGLSYQNMAYSDTYHHSQHHIHHPTSATSQGPGSHDVYSDTGGCILYGSADGDKQNQSAYEPVIEDRYYTRAEMTNFTGYDHCFPEGSEVRLDDVQVTTVQDSVSSCTMTHAPPPEHQHHHASHPHQVRSCSYPTMGADRLTLIAENISSHPNRLQAIVSGSSGQQPQSYSDQSDSTSVSETESDVCPRVHGASDVRDLGRVGSVVRLENLETCTQTSSSSKMCNGLVVTPKDHHSQHQQQQTCESPITRTLYPSAAHHQNPLHSSGTPDSCSHQHQKTVIMHGQCQSGHQSPCSESSYSQTSLNEDLQGLDAEHSPHGRTRDLTDGFLLHKSLNSEVTCISLGDSSAEGLDAMDDADKPYLGLVKPLSTSVNIPEDAYTNCLKTMYTYNNFDATLSYHEQPAISPRHLPHMQQPGYTSVIVDAQQYQATNGFVH